MLYGPVISPFVPSLPGRGVLPDRFGLRLYGGGDAFPPHAPAQHPGGGHRFLPDRRILHHCHYPSVSQSHPAQGCALAHHRLFRDDAHHRLPVPSDPPGRAGIDPGLFPDRPGAILYVLCKASPDRAHPWRRYPGRGRIRARPPPPSTASPCWRTRTPIWLPCSFTC